MDLDDEIDEIRSEREEAAAATIDAKSEQTAATSAIKAWAHRISG